MGDEVPVHRDSKGELVHAVPDEKRRQLTDDVVHSNVQQRRGGEFLHVLNYHVFGEHAKVSEHRLQLGDVRQLLV